LAYANEVICEEITPGKFVTLFYAVIDSQRGEIICGNAGHPEPKLIHVDDAGEPVIESVQLEGLALGILPGQDYEERRYSFGPGRSIVAYTDGVVEARRDSRLYGQYRLERRLSEEAGASATRLAFAVYEDCNAYAEDRLGDDVAIVVAQHVLPDDHED
jgi:sigma-B regulation protein RsbU (phosphoserine phosphatase)